jgi:hypothetical protein
LLIQHTLRYLPAQLLSPLTATATAEESPLTVTGALLSSGVPSPSCPSALSPQQYSAPARTTHA